jgi:hydrogenase maturation protease
VTRSPANRLIAYGNPARGDDGLGPAFAKWAAGAGFAGLSVRERFQLSVDDALWISDAARVVFVDAAIDGAAPFRFRRAHPDARHPLSTHAASPETVLALAETLYGAAPEAHVLEIAGHAFGDIREGLSPEAKANLDAAKAFFKGWMAETAAVG